MPRVGHPDSKVRLWTTPRLAQIHVPHRNHAKLELVSAIAGIGSVEPLATAGMRELAWLVWRSLRYQSGGPTFALSLSTLDPTCIHYTRENR